MNSDPTPATAPAAPPTPVTAPVTSPPPAPAPAPRRGFLRRTRRWLKRLLVTLVALLLAARLALPWILPPVLDGLLEDRGLSIEYSRLDLSLLGGHVQIWHLALLPRPTAGTGAESAIAPVTEAEKRSRAHVFVEFVDLDLDVLALVTGTVRIRRAEVDGVDLRLARLPDGSLDLLHALAGPPGPEPAAPVPAPEPAPKAAPAPLDFRLPVQLLAGRVQEVRVHLRDLTQTPPLVARLDLDLRLSDLGVPEHPGRVELTVACDPALDALRLVASVTGGERALQARARLELIGVHPGPFAGWLRPLGIEPRADALDVAVDVNARLAPAPDSATACSGEVALEGLRVLADQDEAVAVDQVRVEFAMDARALRVREASVVGVRAHAERRAGGALAVAGMELLPAPKGAAAPAPPPAPPDESGPPLDWQVLRAAVTGVAVRFVDESLTPPLKVELRGDEIRAEDLVCTPAQGELRGRVRARLALPGLVEQVEVSGDLTHAAARRGVQAELAVTGIDATCLTPLLAPAGLVPELRNGSLRLRVGGEFRAAADTTGTTLTVSELSLADGAELLALDRLALERVELGPGTPVRLGQLVADGLRTKVRRDAAGALHVPGLCLLPPPPGPPKTTAPDTSPAPAPSSAPSSTPSSAPLSTPSSAPAAPPMAIQRIALTNARLEFRDEQQAGTPPLVTEGLGLEVTGLRLGGAEVVPARLKLQVGVPEVCDRLTLEGAVGLRPSPLLLRTELELRATGVRGRGLTPWLAPLGVEPLWAAGELQAGVTASLEQQEGGLRAEAALRDVAVRDGGAVPLALQSLAVRDARVGDAGVQVAAVEVRGPELAVAREVAGTMVFAGVRLLPKAPALEEGSGTPETRPASRPATRAQSAPTQGGTPLSLGRLMVDGVRVRWHDAMVSPAVDVATELSLLLERLQIAPLASPASLDLRVRVPENLDELRLVGQLVADPMAPAFLGRLQLQGLRSGALAAYLPPGRRLTLTEGRLRFLLEAGAARLRDGGHAARVILRELELADAGREEPLLAADEVALRAPRLDAEAGVFLVEELAVRGVSLDVHRHPDRLELLGVSLQKPPVTPEEPKPREPLIRRAIGTAARKALALSTLPTIQVQRLDVGIARLTLHDPARRDALPLDLALSLTNPEPLQLLAADPTLLPPLRLALRGHCQPIAGAIAADLELRPWEADPSAELRLALDHLRGPGITEFLPELATRLDGSELTDGELRARLRATLYLQRRQPTDFDLGGGFGLEASLEDVSLRAVPGGPVLAGLRSARVDVRRVLPATGEVHVRSVELVRPEAHLRKEPQGLRAAGLLLKPPPAESRPAPASGPPAPPRLTASGTAPEVRVDVFSLTGLDVSWQDVTTTPPTVVPLTGLDLEVHRFTTRALGAPLPIRFQMSLSAGIVELPERLPAASLLSTFSPLSAITGAVGLGREESLTLERRPLLEEFSASGVLKLWPWTEGWARVHLGQFELTSLRGLAQEGGVTLRDGTLDAGVGLRFDARGCDVDARIVFGSLSVSEPTDGPISSYLKLPAPLGTVLYVLQDESGEQVIPLQFHVERKGVDDRAVAGVAISTLGKVIAVAIARSPLRVTASLTGTITGLFGLGGGAKEDLGKLARTVSFEVADAALLPVEAPQLGPLIERLLGDSELALVLEHHVGAPDLERAQLLANPAAPDARALHKELRQRRDHARQLRDEAAARARAEFAVGRPLAAQAEVARVQVLERELAECEGALDQALDLLRPGAEARRDRRAQDAVQELGQARLQAVRDQILRVGGAELARRVELRRPRVECDGRPVGGVVVTPRRR